MARRCALLRPRRLRHRRSQPAGFTLVELLVGAALLAVVIAGLSRLLVSELWASRRALRAIGGTEGAAQAVNLMREEIAQASRIQITNTPPTGCTTTPSFVLRGPGSAWQIAYGIRARSNDEATTWFGPWLLVRCGVPYSSLTGNLDTAGTVAERVVADRLPTTNGLVVTSTGGTTTNLIRDLALTLNQRTDAGTILPTTFSARIGVNRLYGTLDRLSASDCPASADNTCNEGTDDIQHFWPTGSGATVDGNKSKENVIYFKNKFSRYTFSNPCTNASCTVTGLDGDVGVTITYGDLLVFPDQELRL